MGPEIAAGLAGTAASTVVALMVTEAWTSARARVVALWHRLRPEQEEEIAHGLDASRRTLSDAPGNPLLPDLREPVTQALAARFQELLDAHPDEAGAALRELAALHPDGGGPQAHVTIVTTHGDGAPAVGRDNRGRITTHVDRPDPGAPGHG